MIEVHNSHIVITEYKKNQYEKLENILSVWDKVTFQYTWNNYYYNEEKNELVIPGGFSVRYLQNILNHMDKVYIEDYIKPGKATYKTIVEPRDDKQVEAINFLIGENDLSKNSTERMLCLQTGGGKTYCTINALSKLGLRSLVVVDKEKLMLQWKKEFLKFTNLKDDDIYLISGRDSIDRLMRMKVTDIRNKVFIAMHQTLFSYISSGEDINKFFTKLKIGVNVFDEAHCYVNSMFNINFLSNVKYTFYLTATPNRSNNQEDRVFQISLKEVPKYGLEDKYNDPYHHIWYISYNSKPEYKYIASFQTKRGFDINKFSDYTMSVAYEQFYDIVTKLIDTALGDPEFGKICLILHKNDHIKKIKTDLEADYPDTPIGVFSTLVSDIKKREKELDKKIILSTDKSMQKGIDVRNLQFVIAATPFSSTVIAEQMLGRLRKIDGKVVTYFDLADIGFKSCISQRKSRRSVLDKKAKSIKLLNL